MEENNISGRTRENAPFAWDGATAFACEDVTGEAGSYPGQENMSACLYKLTIEE